MEEKTNSRSGRALDSLNYSGSRQDKVTKKRMSFESANSDLKSVNSTYEVELKTMIVNRHNYEVQAEMCYINDKIPWYRRIKLWFNRLFRRW